MILPSITTLSFGAAVIAVLAIVACPVGHSFCRVFFRRAARVNR
jgi:hypothetical protein